MESPPSTSMLSETYMLSEDSGLLITSNSISSGSLSGDSHQRLGMELQDSDCEDKSLSQVDSLDGMSDIMCGENFNTLKKGPHWIDSYEYKYTTPIEPPPEFQDKPNILIFEALANKIIPTIIREGINNYYKTHVKCIDLNVNSLPTVQCFNHQVLTSYWTSEFLPFGSPPSTRQSLHSSRLSSSHNSLSVLSAYKVDDSSFITQAVSHDTLVSSEISDIYNVPFDSDIYAVPVDVIKQPLKYQRNQQHKKRRRNASLCCQDLDERAKRSSQSNFRKYYLNYVKCNCLFEKQERSAKRHSVPGSSARVDNEPVHMTLEEVRHYLQTLHSSSSDSSVNKDKDYKNNNNYNKYPSSDCKILLSTNTKSTRYSSPCASSKLKKSTFLINIKNRCVKDPCENITKEEISLIKSNKPKKSNARMSSLKQTLCNLFRFRRFMSPDRKKSNRDEEYGDNIVVIDKGAHKPIINRALPPLPSKKEEGEEEHGLDFTTSIQKVKDYGWYWGPISSEAAERILSNEPDGSFIVRDSSDDHYIFSLTFKLNNSVRHVRIEHDQGNFSFGSCTKFKSQTIVEFIENAVEHSRSGRYLFFLHRRPVIGPVRVQLLHPVSRFKQIQSLQHMCRFVILKLIRRDLLSSLPLPRRMIDYLNTPHYYSEFLSDVEEQEENGTSSGNNINNSITLYNNIQSNNQDNVTNVNSNENELAGSVFISNPRQS